MTLIVDMMAINSDMMTMKVDNSFKRKVMMVKW